MWVWDHGSGIQGKKAPDPGSGSATLEALIKTWPPLYWCWINSSSICEKSCSSSNLKPSQFPSCSKILILNYKFYEIYLPIQKKLSFSPTPPPPTHTHKTWHWPLRLLLCSDEYSGKSCETCAEGFFGEAGQGGSCNHDCSAKSLVAKKAGILGAVHVADTPTRYC